MALNKGIDPYIFITSVVNFVYKVEEIGSLFRGPIPRPSDWYGSLQVKGKMRSELDLETLKGTAKSRLNNLDRNDHRLPLNIKQLFQDFDMLAVTSAARVHTTDNRRCYNCGLVTDKTIASKGSSNRLENTVYYTAVLRA